MGITCLSFAPCKAHPTTHRAGRRQHREIPSLTCPFQLWFVHFSPEHCLQALSAHITQLQGTQVRDRGTAWGHGQVQP